MTQKKGGVANLMESQIREVDRFADTDTDPGLPAPLFLTRRPGHLPPDAAFFDFFGQSDQRSEMLPSRPLNSPAPTTTLSRQLHKGDMLSRRSALSLGRHILISPQTTAS